MKFSLSAWLCAVSLLSLIGAVSSSKADSQPYCTAYARDLANRKVTPPDAAIVSPASDLVTTTASISQPTEDDSRMDRLWRRAYKTALRSCLEQYSDAQPRLVTPVSIAPKVAAPVKPVAKKVVKQASAPEDGPKRGSDEWKRKCLAQHPSFNAETGSYRTYSGAQRECRL